MVNVSLTNAKVLRERQLPGHAIAVEIPDEEPSPVKNGEAPALGATPIRTVPPSQPETPKN